MIFYNKDTGELVNDNVVIKSKSGGMIVNPSLSNFEAEGYLPVSKEPLAPLQEYATGSEVNGIWVIPAVDMPIEKAKGIKTAEIKQSCRSHIVSGCVSSALGTDYTYPTSELDQSNMTGVWARSRQLGTTGEPYYFWCADSNGDWKRRPHTAAQIEQAALDISQHVVDAQARYADLLDQINAATTVDELNNINW